MVPSKKYEILEHKADLKIRAFGKTKQELFLNMLFGMTSALRAKIKAPAFAPPSPRQLAGFRRASKDSAGKQKSPYQSRFQRFETGQAKIKKIKVGSLDLETLLVDFLSEVLYLTQVNKEIYTDIKFKKFTDSEIEGELISKEVERFGEDIKAVTYHSLDVHQRKDGIWEAIVLFDV